MWMTMGRYGFHLNCPRMIFVRGAVSRPRHGSGIETQPEGSDKMTKLEEALGPGDEDVENFKAGVGGLAFSGFTDEQIAAFAVEEAQAYRAELNEQTGGRAFPVPK
jgi:hypothetical protein